MKSVLDTTAGSLLYSVPVTASSRKLEGCQHVADAIIAAGGKATAIACHIGEMGQISQVLAGIKQQFGRLDILVNNAATNPPFCNVLDTDLSAFQKTVDVNIRGYFFMSVEAGKLMRENGGDQHDQGVCQGMRAVRDSLQCLAAGVDRHQIRLGAGEERSDLNTALAQIPLKRVADPSEMAGAVLYLASDASSYTTGVSLNVDEGFLS
jgi:NAD(P)-dependent dehydrogenase (short-subunit alcohol dehydrogenase family)